MIDIMSFEFLLVALTVLSGLLVLLDQLWLKKRRLPGQPRPFLYRNAYEFFPVLLIVLLLRSFLVEPFRIPTGSLEPSLIPGDFVAASKFAYGVRLPLTYDKIWSVGEPRVGDVAVFRWPVDPRLDFIKRVVGIPGDTISYQNKVLYINGVQQPQRYVGKGVDREDGAAIPVEIYEETLNGVKHLIYINPAIPPENFTVTVPAGDYFMMGDNRDNSYDSRGWGFVPENHLLGRAFLIWFSWAGMDQGWVRWSRIGERIGHNRS